jgi:hypothetical protein
LNVYTAARSRSPSSTTVLVGCELIRNVGAINVITSPRVREAQQTPGGSSSEETLPLADVVVNGAESGREVGAL